MAAKINCNLLFAAIRFQLEALNKGLETDRNPCETMWRIHRLEEQIEALEYRPASTELTAKGGVWLGVVREWMQSKFRNGDLVTFGSHEALVGTVTPAGLERLASIIAAEAVREHMGAVTKSPGKTTNASTP